ncbi:MAG: hypothetical protein ACRD7E_02090, partial [Bryobacteraceae bacterium]
AAPSGGGQLNGLISRRGGQIGPIDPQHVRQAEQNPTYTEFGFAFSVISLYRCHALGHEE